jgi:hypothetical protein
LKSSGCGYVRHYHGGALAKPVYKVDTGLVSLPGSPLTSAGARREKSACRPCGGPCSELKRSIYDGRKPIGRRISTGEQLANETRTSVRSSSAGLLLDGIQKYATFLWSSGGLDRKGGWAHGSLWNSLSDLTHFDEQPFKKTKKTTVSDDTFGVRFAHIEIEWHAAANSRDTDAMKM